MIYTSYFANWRKYPKDYKIVSISRFTQKWIKYDENDLSLAPSQDILIKYKNNEISEEEYEKMYLEQLSKLDPLEIAEKHKKSILLCYEKSNEFCHRNILANWLKSFNIEIEEL